MSFNNTEIEIKLVVDPGEYERVKNELDEMAQYIGETDQVDHYFSPSNEGYMDEEYPYKWLSVRERGGRNILNFKHFYPEGGEKHSHCDEYETEISSPSALKNILKELNIVKLVTVSKNRIVYLYKNDFEISLDRVENLGCFVEIEATKDHGGVDKTREKIMDVVLLLKLDSSRVDYRGYPFQLLEK
ncbi:class IV adenylate cyclase [Desulfosediminicola ganghwensis]|uniref:class IV adenylate cyclase n=1 Tax=Desulfosediminicola ganghwensis TaxID=2569540 RepID=UPI0010AD1E30|nr:class IV adenylate cyclase [Desulfosediminicola ganghwensis]